MAVKLCSCEGLDPKCKKCFGSGYIETAESGKPTQNPKENNAPQKRKSLLPDEIRNLPGKELENILVNLIDSLDVKSKKQMQLLNSIPFNTTTFRRDFKDKFESLRNIESDKQFLRSELDIALNVPNAKKIAKHLSFSHFLSDKEIDVTSNRQLKTLIREYKKLKNQSKR